MMDDAEKVEQILKWTEQEGCGVGTPKE
jgi:hypothetical protein